MIVRIEVDDDGFRSPSVEVEECEECGALIGDPFRHSVWHDSMRGDRQ